MAAVNQHLCFLAGLEVHWSAGGHRVKNVLCRVGQSVFDKRGRPARVCIAIAVYIVMCMVSRQLLQQQAWRVALNAQGVPVFYRAGRKAHHSVSTTCGASHDDLGWTAALPYTHQQQAAAILHASMQLAALPTRKGARRLDVCTGHSNHTSAPARPGVDLVM